MLERTAQSLAMGGEGIFFGDQHKSKLQVVVAALAGVGIFVAALLLGAPLDTSAVIAAVAFALASRPRRWVLAVVVFVLAIYILLLVLWQFLPDT